jgi:hypothetical protein
MAMNLDQTSDTITPSTGALTVSGRTSATNIPTTGTVLASVTAPATNPASGTPSSSNYLRGDGTWASVTATTANNLAGGALGSIPYQLLSGSTTFLAGNTTATPQFVTSTGVASLATAPTLTGSTGSGNVVLATSPTLVTPALGTPSSGTLTNCTFPTLNQNTTGTSGGLTGTPDITVGTLQFNSGYGSSATAYGCRAWVYFNGVTTTTINGSGNVSSVTRNGTGLYTINFTNSMPDTNYAAAGTASRSGATTSISYLAPSTNTTYTTSAYQFYTTNDGGSAEDSARCSVMIFR